MMRIRGVFVHHLGSLRAAATLQAAEFPCGYGVRTRYARKLAKAVHHFDVVMSHSFNCNHLSPV